MAGRNEYGVGGGDGASIPSDVQFASAEPDFRKIDEEVREVIEQGGGRPEVEEILKRHEVTAEELLNGVMPWGEWIEKTAGEAYEGAKDMVMGVPDPKFEGIEGFTGEGILDPHVLAKINRAKPFAVEDRAYGKIIVKALGDRVIDAREDNQGRDVIAYKGDDGKTYVTYINEPGLDFQDVDRTANQAAPFLVGGGLGTAAGKGFGVAGRIAGVGGAEALTSLGMDFAADRMGGEQPYDPTRALFAAGFGMLFEGLSSAAAAGWRKIFSKGGISANGQLSHEAAVEAKRLGLDPDDMDDRVKQYFGENIGRASDKEELATQAQLQEFGLPSTKGQRTKDPALIADEETMRRGTGDLGKAGSKAMRDFDKEQKGAVSKFVREEYPGRLGASEGGIDPIDTGGRVQSGMRSSKAKKEAQEEKVWGKVEDVPPKQEGLDMLPDSMQEGLKKRGVIDDIDLDPKNSGTPQSRRMINEIEGYWKGDLKRTGSDLLGTPDAEGVIPVDRMRRRLLGYYKSAERGSNDSRVAKDIYDSYNDWLGEAAKKAALEGSPELAVRIQTARGFTKELKDMFSPNLRKQDSPVAQILSEVMETDTPERVANIIFAGAGSRGDPKRGVVGALRRIKRALGEKSDEWGDVKLAYWIKMTHESTGEVMSPTKLRNSIDAAFYRQPTVLKTLFTDAERKKMKGFSDALEHITVKPPNPSGTSYEMDRILKKFKGNTSMAKRFMEVKQKSETFAKRRFLMARMYQELARRLPINPLHAKETASEALARKMTTQEMGRRGVPRIGGAGAAVGSTVEEQFVDE